MKGRVLAVVAAGVVVAALGSFAAFKHLENIFFGTGPSETAQFVDVPRGATVGSLADILVSNGIIADGGLIPATLVFELGARSTEKAGSIKFGTFELPPGVSMSNVLDIVSNPGAQRDRYIVTYTAGRTGGTTVLRERVAGSGKSEQIARFSDDDAVPTEYTAVTSSGSLVAYRVSIPEGLTSWQIVASLSSAEFLDGEVAEIPAEGTLAPDTYDVPRNYSRMALLNSMQDAQERIVEEEWENRAPDLPVADKREALILASIIEMETGVAEERKLVSSVFVNRLETGMRLQTDASIRYGLTEGKEPLDRGLRQSEMKRDTPYNTYIHGGFPPTPITNPGRHAIHAALNPADTEYLFFVAAGAGGHRFATTYKEHRKNVREWRKVEASLQKGN